MDANSKFADPKCIQICTAALLHARITKSQYTRDPGLLTARCGVLTNRFGCFEDKVI